MRPNVLLILLLLSFSRSSVGQQSSPSDRDSCIQKAGNLLNESVGLMQKYYYKKDSVQWDQFLKNARERLHSSPNCESASEVLRWSLSQLNENHSYILVAPKAAVYNGSKSTRTVKLPDELTGPINHELVEQEIAYINLPWIATADPAYCTKIADSLQEIVASYDRKGINKWIIDLRQNTGGNCWPMLAGLSPLLENGVLGYFISDTDKIPISLNNGSVSQGRNIRISLTNPYELKTAIKSIVLLTGPHTSSAAEIVALAFKGRERVYLYGEPTAGLTTANATYPLSDGSLLVLTVCKEADRSGKIIEGKIYPDVHLPSGGFNGKDGLKTSALMFLQMD